MGRRGAVILVPLLKIEPVTIGPDNYRHVLKTRITVLLFWYVAVWPIGYFFAWQFGYMSTKRWLMMPVLALPLVLAAFALILVAQRMASATFQAFVNPRGSRASLALTSRAESLVARGQYDEAAAEFAALRVKYPHDVPLLRTEAEFHAGTGGNPQIAVQVLNQLRRVPDVSSAVERYATHRLLDLYVGVLADPGRAMVELRRMADRFPDTPDGQGALAELRRRREQLAQDQTEI